MICTLFPLMLVYYRVRLDDTVFDYDIFLHGYSIVRLDCSRHGSSDLLYVQDLFTCSHLFKGTPDFECLIVAINSSAGPRPDFTVALFYRPPSSSHAVLDTSLRNHFVSSSPSFFLVDFNTDFQFLLLCILNSFNLIKVVSEPTHV